jgi:hypothetical protein
VYNGQRHLYSVETGEKKVHILQMQKDFSSSRKTVLCAPKEEFELELEEEGLCLIVTSTTFPPPEQEEHPRLVEPILTNYMDVLGKLPDGLPPLWDIQYQIDLVPGSILPNKAHYRMSPDQHEELRRQVQELLNKGFV